MMYKPKWRKTLRPQLHYNYGLGSQDAFFKLGQTRYA